jgi:hypothetical protein
VAVADRETVVPLGIGEVGEEVNDVMVPQVLPIEYAAL